MKNYQTKGDLKRELRRIYKAMDFVSENFLRTGRKQRTQQIYFDIYQGLGLAWEFLGLRCRHWDGFRRKGGKAACRICGKVKGVRDQYCLMLMDGTKRIGTRVEPNSKRIFDNKKKAQLVRDEIAFHGAALKVDVHNSYKSTLFGKGRKINVAADRILTLRESGIKCSVDQYVIDLKMEERLKDRNKRLRYGGFPWELSKEKLKHFPVIFRFDDNYKFLGLTIIRPVKK